MTLPRHCAAARCQRLGIIRPVNIGIALFADAEELDFAGPWEVLAFWARGWPGDGVTVFTVAEDLEPVRCAKGLRVLPDHTWQEAPSLDVLVYPGGRGTRAQLEPADPIHARLRALAAAGTLMTSVCTGSLVFAAAGLLHHRSATTHWGSLERLAELDPSIDVRPEDRFVGDGAIITAAGVSAGIDMALYLVARLHSTDRAIEVRRGIQYDPEPPV